MSSFKTGYDYSMRSTEVIVNCRSNAGNARILGMGDDLELTGNRFNIAMTAFYLSYIVLEV